jgi:fatty acid desaturase
VNNDAVYEHSPVTRRKVTDIFSKEEIRQLTQRSDLMGFWAIGSTWAIIAASFIGLAHLGGLPVWLAVPLAVLCVAVIAGRQLALAILMHDASHATLFKTKWLNDVFTDWVCARPIWNDLLKYRAHHFIHHTKTGTPDDADISLVANFPTTRASLTRKFLRDISGLTGLKFFLGRLLQDAGYLKWTVASDVVVLPRNGRQLHDYAFTALRNMTPMLIANGVLFAIFALAGHPMLYGVWVLAYATPFPLFVRIRSMAEHGCLERTPDMFRNTRTTRAGWLARSFVAPLRVHYHIEHHVMASVPYFRLQAMHRLLRERGAVGTPPGYAEVLRIVSSVEAAQEA